MGSKPDKTRSDLKAKPKSKQRSEKYLRYQKYIRSKAFKEVRKIVFERDGYACVTCGRTRADGANLTCHHKCYKHLYEGGQIEANDCVCLCQYCHKGLHQMKPNYKWFSIDNERNNNEDENT